MKALIQRVTQASVSIEGDVVGEIGHGLLVFLGVEKADDEGKARKLLNKLLKYRVFSDSEGKMNLGLQDVAGEMLIVSQFTLVADTKKGLRPSFSTAAPPEMSLSLYDYFVRCSKESGLNISVGQFGADMQVSLVNDGPVTFILSE